ncbi:MAG TPA: DUF2497 domain-containing protein [Sphingobium sp.]|uniref:DUF2497 domain-containing protein n=1 Tax=Sphingobium sp. TaxID=1912891 RepID=UPI002ED0F8F9
MGVVTNEPSMEDILSSIKRIIADGSDRAASTRGTRRRASSRDENDATTGSDEEAETARDAEEHDHAILELTEMVEEASAPAEEEVVARPEPAPLTARKGSAKLAALPAAATAAAQEEQILSDISAQAARQSLSQLSSLLVRPPEGEANTLDGLVREMLRPMLKDWLEAKLPELVESMVKKEIDRIVGRLG